MIVCFVLEKKGKKILWSLSITRAFWCLFYTGYNNSTGVNEHDYGIYYYVHNFILNCKKIQCYWIDGVNKHDDRGILALPNQPISGINIEKSLNSLFYVACQVVNITSSSL